MGNSSARGNEKPPEQIYLSPTPKKNFPEEPNLPGFTTAASRMLNDPRSPTGEYARTPIYRADMGAVVTSQSEDVHQGNSFTLEPEYAVKTISFAEKDSEDFESEHAVSNDVLIQNESGYVTTKKRNTSSSQTSSQGTTSYESQRTTRHVSSTRQSISGADGAANTPSFSQHSVRAVGLLTSFRSPGSASSKYQRINNE